MPKGAAEAGRAEGVCLYYRVTRIERAGQELTNRGVPFGDAPHLIATMPDHELWMGFFRDPDRNLVALMEEKR